MNKIEYGKVYTSNIERFGIKPNSKIELLDTRNQEGATILLVNGVIKYCYGETPAYFETFKEIDPKCSFIDKYIVDTLNSKIHALNSHSLELISEVIKVYGIKTTEKGKIKNLTYCEHKEIKKKG